MLETGWLCFVINKGNTIKMVLPQGRIEGRAEYSRDA